MEPFKKNLFLVGAGDFGREMESWLELLPDFHEKWDIKGYLDDNLNALNGFPSEYSVLDNPLKFHFTSNDYVLMCITNTEAKQNLADNLKNKVKFFNFIAPDATISKYVNIGNGSIICLKASISTNVTIDDFVFINIGTHVGHDCHVGAYCSIMPNVDIGGDVRIGQKVFIGANSTIIPKITVYDNITIGAGSIVIRDLKVKGTYFGNPAKLIST